MPSRIGGDAEQAGGSTHQRSAGMPGVVQNVSSPLLTDTQLDHAKRHLDDATEQGASGARRRPTTHSYSPANNIQRDVDVPLDGISRHTGVNGKDRQLSTCSKRTENLQDMDDGSVQVEDMPFDSHLLVGQTNSLKPEHMHDHDHDHDCDESTHNFKVAEHCKPEIVAQQGLSSGLSKRLGSSHVAVTKGCFMWTRLREMPSSLKNLPGECIVCSFFAVQCMSAMKMSIGCCSV